MHEVDHFLISNVQNYSLNYSPVECKKLQIVAIYSILLFILSIVFNSKMVFVFLKYKELFNSLNIFIISLSVLNIFATLGELPFIIISNLYCRLINQDNFPIFHLLLCLIFCSIFKVDFRKNRMCSKCLLYVFYWMY